MNKSTNQISMEEELKEIDGLMDQSYLCGFHKHDRHHLLTLQYKIRKAIESYANKRFYASLPEKECLFKDNKEICDKYHNACYARNEAIDEIKKGWEENR